jgi:hypothetical protein
MIGIGLAGRSSPAHHAIPGRCFSGVVCAQVFLLYLPRRPCGAGVIQLGTGSPAEILGLSIAFGISRRNGSNEMCGCWPVPRQRSHVTVVRTARMYFRWTLLPWQPSHPTGLQTGHGLTVGWPSTTTPWTTR